MARDKENLKRWWIERRLKIRTIVEEAKNKPCMDCGIKYPVFVMVFDHVRGTKKFQIGEATCKAKSIKALLEEIEKCDVVCQNCHTIRTFRMRGYKI